MIRKVVIVEALRTAVGKFGGSLRDIPAPDLGANVIQELLYRTGIGGNQVDEVIMGNVLQAGIGQNSARQAAIKAGIPVEVPCFVVNKVCGSGLKAINLAAQTIALGDADIVVAGGMENMSQAPYLLRKARWGHRMGHGELIDSMIYDGLWCILGDYHMGVTAENLAKKYDISREEQDKYAVLSQYKANRAISRGLFDQEIVAVPVPQKKGRLTFFKEDEYPRSDTTLEKLSMLMPVFEKNGTVTAGNASGINDGAAATILMSEQKAAEMGLKGKAKIRAFASAGVEPATMGLGAVIATQKVLQKASLSMNDLDLVEANEAFAVTAIVLNNELGWEKNRVNVNGGAIAYGHPIGATGAKLFVNLIHEMERRNGHFGLITLCIGGGQGISTILEM